jgi:hypothetical protein
MWSVYKIIGILSFKWVNGMVMSQLLPKSAGLLQESIKTRKNWIQFLFI